MPTGGESKKAAAAAAETKLGKVGDDLSNDHHQEEEPKPLPMEVYPAPGAGEEEGAEDKWECKGPVPAGETVLCHMDGCDKPAVRIWVGTVTKTEWPYCLSCETKDFGEHVEEEWPATMAATAAKNDDDDVVSPVMKTDVDDTTTTKQDDKEAIVLATPSTKNPDKAVFLTPKPGVEVKDPQDQADGGVEEDDTFELVDFVSFEKMKTIERLCSICADPAMGGSSAKQHLACTIWQGSDPKSKKWYYCIDCQEDDFAGFPTKEELIRRNALKNLDPATIQEHISFMKQKCSRMRNPAVPDLGSYLSSSVSVGGAGRSPLPKTNTNFVTPSPKTLASAKCLTQASGAAKGKGRSTNISKKNLENLQQWQKEAVAAGGEAANLITNIVEAKNKIFHTLFDVFAPMNITGIFNVRIQSKRIGDS